MPPVLNQATELARMIGEAIQDDVECWEAEQDGIGAWLTITHEGVDYVLELRERYDTNGGRIASRSGERVSEPGSTPGTVDPTNSLDGYLAAFWIEAAMRMFGGVCQAFGCKALREVGSHCAWHAAAYAPQPVGYHHERLSR